MKKEILIIGGGFAGLSAGVELSSRGHHVTVIERKGHLGGRAYSFKEPNTGATLDNGQHILMGCYRETLDFLDKIGTRDRVLFQRNLKVPFASAAEGIVPFKTWPFPNPFHLISGFLFFKGLTLKERMSVLKMGRRFQKESRKVATPKEKMQLDATSIPQWLSKMGQSQRIQERFWDPLCLAALNDRPELSSAALFSAVLKEALFSGRKGARIGIPTVGLSDLYTEASRDYIERKGGNFLIKSPVMKLHFRGREFLEAELEGGSRISADYLLVTVPFTALKKLLPESMLYQDPFFFPLAHLKTSPIVAINFWFDREITSQPFVGLWGTKTHWLFNKGFYLKESQPYISLVISGGREELKTPGPQLVEMALAELRSIFPQARDAKLLRSHVMKEPEATLAPSVGVSSLRLSQKTPYKNLFLAGDWTNTGLPATIESAVRSANRAVELIEAIE